MSEEKVPSYAPDKYKWLKRRVALDLLAVDEELQEIGVLIQEAGEHCAFARETRDSAKAELERTEAVVSFRMSNLTGADGKQNSAAKVKAELPMQAEVVEMNSLLIAADLDLALWTNVSDALRTKSHSIRAAADLVAAGFISQDYILNKRRADMRSVPTGTTTRAAVQV